MADKSISDNNTVHDEIRVKGIRANGYGQLPKIIMLDSALPLEAKAIYAYFASYTGGGCSKVFPGRDKIIHDLGVTKDTYYKYFKMLTENGYISVEQKNGKESGKGFKHNIYTLEGYPEKFNSIPDNASENLINAYTYIQKARDISAAGYGNVPKAVMTDTSISLQAKGLYAYLCVFSGENYMAAPSRDTILFHLGIAANAYSKYAKILENNNYVTKQQTTKAGQFGAVVYCLVQNPSVKEDTDEDISPCIEFSDTIKPDTVFSYSVESDTLSSDTEKSDAIISDTNSPNPLPKTKLNNNYPINQSVRNTRTEEKPIPENGLIDTKNTFELINKLRSIDLPAATPDTLDLFYASLDQMLNSEKGTNIQGVFIPAKQFMDFFSQPIVASDTMKMEFISDVCRRYDDYSANGGIKNPIQYMKNIISSTMDMFRRKKPVDEKALEEEMYGRPLPKSLRGKTAKNK